MKTPHPIAPHSTPSCRIGEGSRPSCLAPSSRAPSRKWPVLFLALLSCYLNSASLVAAEHPNVLLVMTDDQGFGDIASHGNPYVRTPVQDGLANSGARFERFFVSPVCAPTRASLLTGRYALRTGVHGVTRGYETMRAEEYTLAEALRDAGYITGAFGKWHNGRHMPNHPNGQGFDEFFGFCGGHWNRYFDAHLERNGTPVVTEGYINDVITEAALQFIKQNQGSPWFCYVPYNTPHSPWRVPQDDWQRYSGMGLDQRARCAYAMVENLDRNLGKLLACVDELGLGDRTLVLFLTDNGANSARFNAGMKGRKGSVDEGGVRVPLLMRWPKVIRAGTVVEHIAAHIDLFPTILELCQVPRHQAGGQAPLPLDGVSLAALLKDKGADWPDRTLFTERFRAGQTVEQVRGAVRTQRWRAVHHPRSGWQLYDMQADPGQQQDVAEEHANVVRELAQEFRNWFAATGARQLGYHPIPVGHPARDQYELPANEAILSPGHGQGIRYHGPTPNGYANCWLADWTSVDAFPRWTLEVLEAANYRVEIQYALARQNAPVQIHLHVARQQLVKSVARIHDPALRPKPDRFHPSTGYQEKESWTWAELGQVHLPTGAAELAVRVDAIPGNSAIELKSVRLTKVDPRPSQQHHDNFHLDSR